MSNISSEIVEDIVVETVNISMATKSEADELKSALLNDIKSGKKKIVVDLSKCESMDSTFLGSLVIAYKESEKEGGTVKIAGAHSDAEVILEITGTSRIFEQYHDKSEAIQSFNKRA
jgi:anti-anti-sigma factor